MFGAQCHPADRPQHQQVSVFEGIRKSIIDDRPAFLTAFLANFYNLDVLKGKRVSDEVVRLSWNIASGASPEGTLDCVSTWLTDFRNDLRVIDVPTLVIHGDADRILPISATGKRINEAILGSRLAVIKGGPHGIIWTHYEEVNRELLDFLKAEKPVEELAETFS